MHRAEVTAEDPVERATGTSRKPADRRPARSIVAC